MLLRSGKIKVVSSPDVKPRRRAAGSDPVVPAPDPQKEGKIKEFESQFTYMVNSVSFGVSDSQARLDHLPDGPDVQKAFADATQPKIKQLAKLACLGGSGTAGGIRDVVTPRNVVSDHAMEVLFGAPMPPISQIGATLPFEFALMDLNRVTYPASIGPTILSMVAYINLGCELDLAKIAENIQGTEYNPKRFAPLAIKLREPYSTALIFRTGKMIISGVRSEEELDVAAKKITKMIKKLGFGVTIINKKIQNISASNHLGFRVKLEEMARIYSKLCVLEYDMFPGLIMSLAHPNVKVILFHTGSYLMTGAKAKEELTTAMEYFFPMAKLFIKL